MAVKECSIPSELKKRKQWVTWKFGAENGKRSKIPINPRTGAKASVRNPETWGSFEETIGYCREHNFRGVGFVFTESDPFAGIDLDNCRNPKTKRILPWARKIIERLNSYTETSPSGKGVKIFVKGKLPGGGRKKGGVEMYDQGRYFTVTGRLLKGTPEIIRDKAKVIKKLYVDYLGKPKEENLKARYSQLNNLSNEEIVNSAKDAINGHKFTRLLDGNIEGYPSQSEADLALARMLAYWTKNDRKRIDAIFRQSGLMRAKWNEVHDRNKNRTYGDITIDKAIALAMDGENDSSYPISTVTNILHSSKRNSQNTVEKILNKPDAINELISLFKNDRVRYEKVILSIKKSASREDIAALKAAVKSKVKGLKPSFQGTGLETVKSILPDAPIPDEALIPQNWQIGNKGISKISPDGTKFVAHFPVLIKRKLNNIVDKSEHIEVIWKKNSKWAFRKVSREEIADARQLLKLARFGFPVTSKTAGPLVEYLSDFEAANSNLLPKAFVSHQLGWQGKDGKYGFLWGRHFLRRRSKVNSAMERKLTKSTPKIYFKGHDEGEEQIAGGFDKKGTFEKWLKIIPLIKNYPIVTYTIYTSLSAPLIPILGAPNFLMDLASKTSSGKTTTLKIAASVWGNPDENKQKSVLKSWDATPTWLERALNVLKNLPLIIDETQIAKHPGLISKFIYSFPSGKGRGRGTPSGMQERSSWETVALSSGEAKATSFSTGGGAHARVLSLWGIPFKEQSEEKHQQIQKMVGIIQGNYGHAGPRFVKYLIKNRGQWREWLKQYSEIIKGYQEAAGQNAVALRQATYIGLIEMAAILAERALGLSINYKTHLKEISKMSIAETFEANKAKEAYEVVMSWASSHKDSFWRQGLRKQPVTGWLGVWNAYGRRQLIAFVPHRLKTFLHDQGYEPNSIIRIWKEERYLKFKGKDLTCKISLEGQRTRYYVLKRENFQKRKDFRVRPNHRIVRPRIRKG